MFNKPCIAVLGEVLFDCFADGSRILGGAPFNVAWHLQAFGVSPLFISRVGNDKPGQEILQALEQWGMNLSSIQVDPEHPTGEVRVVLREREPEYRIVEHCAYDYIDPATIPLLNAESILYHGSLAFRHKASEQCLNHLIRQDVQRFVDINLRSPWWNHGLIRQLTDGACWIKLNDEENAQLAFLGKLSAAEYVLETRSDKGALLTTRKGGEYQVTPASSVTVVDTVGAGDAFSSVMLLAIVQDWPLPIALQRAQDFASAIVGIRGAVSTDQAFYRPFVESWL